MELSRLIRIVRGRWIGVLAAATIGLIVAMVLTSQRNSELTPEFYATAALIFSQQPSDRSGEDLNLRLQDAQVEAIDLNRETMVALPEASVTFDTDLGELYFSAPGGTEEGALELARQMRDAFLGLDTAVNAEVITEQLADIAEEIGPLQLELAALEETPESVLLNQSNASFLSRQIAAFEQRATNLRLELVPGLSDRDPVIVQSELVAVEREIESLNRKLIAIPSEDPVAAAERDLQIKAVSRRIQLLELQYQELYLEQGNLEGRVRLGRATVSDETPAEASIAVNGFLGIAAGLFVSIGGLVLSERTRPLVWLPGDVRSLPLLAQVPRRRMGEGAFVWYETAASEGRKSSLQTFRGAIEGRIGAEVTSIGISGLSTPGSATQALAADLSVGMAVSGRSVLLIDGDFSHPSGLFEYSSTGPTLAEILSVNPDDNESLLAIIKLALTGTPSIRPGLVAIRPGDGLDDPADALAGRHMRLLLAEAQDVFDLVIVAAPEARTPTGQTLLQRVDYAILAVSPGAVSVSNTDGVVDDLARRNVAFLGLVMLPRRRGEGLAVSARGQLMKPAANVPGRERLTAAAVPAGHSEMLRPRPVRRPAGLSDIDDALRESPWPGGDPWEHTVVENGEPVSIEFVDSPSSQTAVDNDAEAMEPEAVELEPVADSLLDAEPSTSEVSDLDDGLESETAQDVESMELMPSEVSPEDVELLRQVLGEMVRASVPSEAAESAFGEDPDKDKLGRFLSALEQIDPAEVIEEVETLLTSWVTSMVSTPLRTHYANRNSIVRYGFAPLFDIRGFSPIRARIRKEFDGPFGARNARRFLAALDRVLTNSGPEDEAQRYSINEWVIDRYWQRHVADTDREPVVWHLSSRHGTIQALIDWTRMDRDHIDGFRSEMVRQRVETLRRKAKSAARAGRSAEAAAFDDQMKDARSLDLALGWLYDGTTPNARIWYPWRPNESPIGWRPNPRQGVKPHLAPLQRLDLLAFPVLTDEEMMRLKPTA